MNELTNEVFLDFVSKEKASQYDIVVYCETELECYEFFKLLSKHNIQWRSGKFLLSQCSYIKGGYYYYHRLYSEGLTRSCKQPRSSEDYCCKFSMCQLSIN